MNRVRKLFNRFRAGHRCGLIAYVTCGDGPTVEIVRALEEAGADAIELGIPFSDPIADGPVIQMAAQRSLKKGTNIGDVFAIADEIRTRAIDHFALTNFIRQNAPLGERIEIVKAMSFGPANRDNRFSPSPPTAAPA